MKICLPSRLRAALVAAVFSVSGFTTLSSAYAAGEEEATDTTLTNLNALDSKTYPNESAYQLEKVTGKNAADLLNVYKSYYDSATGSYKAEQYNVTFTKPLGETKPEGEKYTYYKWVKYRDSNSHHDLLTLEPTREDEADLHMYSTNNNHLMISNNTQGVDRSFFDLKRRDGFGGAISHASTAKPNITGNFIGNGSTGGGAIYAYQSSIGQIKGDFIGNFTSTTQSSYGAAMYLNEASVDSITGDFIANSTSSYSSSYGGAISNLSYYGNDIACITGSFIGNSARSATFASVQGGAIYNSAAGIGFLALDSSMQFTGNFVSNNGEVIKHYEAIYNEGRRNQIATLNYNAYANNSIVVNDGINGVLSGKNYQIININNGRDGADKAIEADGKAFSRVAFNSFVNNHIITVHAGELHLGKFAGTGISGKDGYVPPTQATLNSTNITINAGALVSVQGQLQLNGSSTISTSTTGADGQASTIKGLAADSSISGGSISIVESSNLSIENITLTKISINTAANATLSLENITLGYNNVAASSIMSFTREATPLSYTLTGIDVGAASVTGSLTLDVNMIEGEFDAFNSALAAGADIFFIVEGLEDAKLEEGLIVNFDINGDIYQAANMGVAGSGVQFSIIPEPSTASLSLLALAGLLARRRRKAA